jgi:hypothetical protein
VQILKSCNLTWGREERDPIIVDQHLVFCKNWYCAKFKSLNITSSNYNIMKSQTFLYWCQVLNNMSKIMGFVFLKISAEFFLFLLISSYRQHFYYICHYNFHLDPIILDHIPFIKQYLNTYLLINISKSHNIN